MSNLQSKAQNSDSVHILHIVYVIAAVGGLFPANTLEVITAYGIGLGCAVFLELGKGRINFAGTPEKAQRAALAILNSSRIIIFLGLLSLLAAAVLHEKGTSFAQNWAIEEVKDITDPKATISNALASKLVPVPQSMLRSLSSGVHIVAVPERQPSVVRTVPFVEMLRRVTLNFVRNVTGFIWFLVPITFFCWMFALIVSVIPKMKSTNESHVE